MGLAQNNSNKQTVFSSVYEVGPQHVNGMCLFVHTSIIVTHH